MIIMIFNSLREFPKYASTKIPDNSCPLCFQINILEFCNENDTLFYCNNCNILFDIGCLHPIRENNIFCYCKLISDFIDENQKYHDGMPIFQSYSEMLNLFPKMRVTFSCTCPGICGYSTILT